MAIKRTMKDPTRIRRERRGGGCDLHFDTPPLDGGRGAEGPNKKETPIRPHSSPRPIDSLRFDTPPFDLWI